MTEEIEKLKCDTCINFFTNSYKEEGETIWETCVVTGGKIMDYDVAETCMYYLRSDLK